MKIRGVTPALLVLLACGKNLDNTEAVRRGIIQDVAKRADVGNMDVNVTSVSFRGKEADAVVSFAPKGGLANSGITMRYTLERGHDGWTVKDRSQADIKRHTAGVGEAPGEGGEMRAPPGQFPAGHPPLTDGKRQ